MLVRDPLALLLGVGILEMEQLPLYKIQLFYTYATAGTYDVTLTVNGSADTETKTGYITITPSPVVDLGNDVAICQGDSTLLDAGNGHTNYLWNTGETTQTIYADTAGTYSVTVGNGIQESNNKSLDFEIGDYVEINNYNYDFQESITISAWVKMDGFGNGTLVK